MPEKQLTGEVTSVANIGEQRPNSNSKVFQVTIRVNESDSTLRPAMTTSNEIRVNSLDSALFVPLETIHAQDSMNVVYKRSSSGPVMQQVVLGIMNENDVVIHEGIDLDDELFLSLPADTSNIAKSYLPEDVLEKYRQMEDSLRQQQEEQEDAIQEGPQRRQRMGDRDSFNGNAAGQNQGSQGNNN